MIKVFLLSLLYFVSCQLKCSDLSKPSKPENCFERNVTLGTKCCFFKDFFKMKAHTLSTTSCHEFPKEYTEEMINSLIKEHLIIFPKDYYYTFQTTCP